MSDNTAQTPITDTLAAALARYSLDLPAEQVAAGSVLPAVVGLETKLNLTRHDDYEKFVARDLVDTLEFSKVIGTESACWTSAPAAGCRASCLAIIRPDLQVDACRIGRARKPAPSSEIVRELGAGHSGTSGPGRRAARASRNISPWWSAPWRRWPSY